MALEEQGASICIRESELDADALGDLVGELLDDPARRRALASAARDHGRPDAAAAIVDDMIEWIGTSAGSREASPAPNDETPAGAQYTGLSMTPSLRLGCSSASMRPPMHRPRRPVVVDGAVWE